MAVKRIWHGWTTHENADAYMDLLHKEIFPGIEAKEIEGYLSVELFRRDLEAEVEFVTIMTFRELKDVIAFQGKDYKKCYVPARAQKLLKRWDKTSAHYEAIEKRNYRI
jgi:heme-degrading monooxygenase HmoA